MTSGTTPTGRFSSKGPNIQNISPKTEEFRKIRAALVEPVVETEWRWAISSPEMNTENCWVICFLKEIWDWEDFTVHTKSFRIYTLGMDGVDE